MAIEFDRYIRRPVYAEAVRVTEDNFFELAMLLEGEIHDLDSKKYMRIRVHSPRYERQNRAYVGDWILRTGKHIKIYQNQAFVGAFRPLEEKKHTRKGPTQSPPPINPKKPIEHTRSQWA